MGLSLSVASLSFPVMAQDVAAAKALFQQGLNDMEANRYEAACPAIEASFKMDPRLGTLFTLAECESFRGRIATAVARYDEYLSLFVRLPPDQQANQGERPKIAEGKRTALRSKVPYLTLSLPPGTTPGTMVKRDGVTVSEAALNVSLPIDPGEHEIITESPTRGIAKQRIKIDIGEKKTVLVSLPRELPEKSASSAAPVPVEGGDSSRSEGSRRRMRAAAFAAGGVGILATAVGGITGALALSKQSTINAHCMDIDAKNALCDHEGKAAADSAQALGLASTIGFGVGLAGIAGGVLLFALAPAETSAAKSSKLKWLSVGVLSASTRGVTGGIRGDW